MSVYFEERLNFMCGCWCQSGPYGVRWHFCGSCSRSKAEDINRPPPPQEPAK